MRWDGGDELVLRAAHEITGDPITEYVRLTIKPRDPDMLGYYAPLSAWPIDVTALKVLHITWGLSIGMLSSVREWLALLTQTPALTALHLDRSPEAPEDLCLALYATSPKPSKLVCPQLNILTITRPRWASDQYTPIICKMLRLRDQVGGQPLHVVLENVDGWSEEDQNLLVEAGFADRVNLVQT
ncbi:hypothetical protein BD414DRAFT_476638 [Trametes punicea]|nr:hypothetical protein BD414DRAFT_476638 [Trametes punicea]